jgi:hypothetical protein
MSSLDLTLLKILNAVTHVLLKVAEQVVDVGLKVARHVGALPAEVFSVGGADDILGVVMVLVNLIDIVASVIEILPTDDLLDLCEDVLVVLEDGGVDTEHLNLVFDLCEALLASAREILGKVCAEPVDELKGFLMAHEVLYKHLILNTALLAQVVKAGVISGDPVLNVLNLIVGVLKFVLKELCMILSVIVGVQSLGFNGQKVGNGFGALSSLGLVAGVGIFLLIADALTKIIYQVKYGVKYAVSGGCGFQLAGESCEH